MLSRERRGAESRRPHEYRQRGDLARPEPGSTERRQGRGFDRRHRGRLGRDQPAAGSGGAKRRTQLALRHLPSALTSLADLYGVNELIPGKISHVTPEQVKHYIETGLPCDHLEVTGDGSISRRLSSARSFAAKTWCSQHQRVYQAWARACMRKSMRCR